MNLDIHNVRDVVITDYVVDGELTPKFVSTRIIIHSETETLRIDIYPSDEVRLTKMAVHDERKGAEQC
jgi:hypothetical protein